MFSGTYRHKNTCRHVFYVHLSPGSYYAHRNENLPGIFSVLCRRMSGNLPEGFCKVAWTFETAEAADFKNRKIRFAQQDAGACDPVMDQILDRRKMQHLLEAAQAFTLTDTGVCGKFGDSDAARVVFLQVKEQLFNSGILRHRGWGGFR